jgi:competence protein ComEC
LSRLLVTIIDVGWGDSLLLEIVDDQDRPHYALVDSNDTSTLRSSHIFLKRFFERQGLRVPTSEPLFEWILLTHAHADHGQGLKRIMTDYGTSQFWYPKTVNEPLFFTDLLRYAQRSSRVAHHQAIDNTKILPDFGNVPIDILWPPYNWQPSNENNNSVVLMFRLGNVTVVLTGDAEGDVWTQIAGKIPTGTILFKVPHHGSDNGMFDSSRQTPWLDRLGPTSRLAISSHILPFHHPSGTVVNKLNQSGLAYYRTDLHYHITLETDGHQVQVQYSHI